MHKLTPNLPKRVNSDLTPDNGIGSTPQTVRTPGNSVGVAISQPRVEVRSASTLGIGTKKGSNAEPKVTGAALCDAER